MNLEKIIRWGIYTTALIPLVIFKEFLSPFHFGKVVIFRSIVEIMLAMFLLLIWKDRSFVPRLNKSVGLSLLLPVLFLLLP